MELIRGLVNLRPKHRGCVATIGNFDGVHLGHQAVLGQLAEKAAELNLPAVVITFEPYPQEYFAHAINAKGVPPRLTRFREKVQALRRYSIDKVLCLHFNTALAGTTAQEFIRTVLVDGLDVRYLVIGDDFRFGKQRQGDFAMLKAAGAEHGFQVVNRHTFSIEGARVSSTRIRAALAQGDLGAAEKLLGRPYRMCGRVARGAQRGRSIGFPTANIYVHRRATPVQGVFAVEMFGLDGEPLAGVANVGTRPTVNGTAVLLEVHLFDFAQDIYGRYVQVDFLKRLRDEQRFASLDELKKQIHIDAQQARDFFDKRDPLTSG
jgi:riboflavin kinase/FMN adenylyltransferase